MQDVELSWAEKLEQKGLEKGLEKGRKEGIETGSLMAKRATLMRQLASKFGVLPDAAVERIESIGSADELDALLDRVLSATSLDEMNL